MNQEAEALHEQREWLRVTLASIGDAVITTDINNDVNFLNSVAQSLTGWTQVEAAGVPLTTVFKIINEDSRRTVENPATRALRDGVVVGLANHTLLISRDGTERPIDDSAAPIRNAAGEIAGVVLVFRDVTERRQQDRSLRDALNYAESIIATVRESLVVLDDTLSVKSANRCFYQTFNTTVGDTEHRFIYELGSGQWDIPELRTLLEDVLPNNHQFDDFEVVLDIPNLGRKIMRLNARRIFREGNGSETILLAIEDITGRRHAEQQLKESEVRYRRLFETAQDAILILDATSGKILDANPYIKNMLGYSQEELVGKELWEIGLFNDIDQNKTAFRELQQERYIRYEHLPLETKSGKAIEIEFVSNVYTVDNHDVIQCNIRDITERARLERQTQAQAEELADLHRRKDEFLAMLSHELRNPLSAIVNAVHLIRLQEDENAVQKMARGVLERQVGQLSHLINDLMEVSRVITGRIRLQLERLDFRGVVEHVVTAMRPAIEKRRQNLTISLPREPVWLNADASRLEQVVVNLLGNAAKYTDEGGHIWLTVDVEDIPLNDGDIAASLLPPTAASCAVLRVRDTGIGIPFELLPRIFDLFTQAERTLDRAQGGLGIGLSLVQKLVELHGGTVAAESDGPGLGSEFITRLPLADLMLAAAKTALGQRPATADPHSLSVLVVDDNIDSADTTAMLLRATGHNVHTAYCGLDTIDAATKNQPDVVLLDIGMQDINGYEVARRLRRTPATSNMWLIATTGYGQASDRQMAMDAGFDHHLVKPIELEKLQELLTMLAKTPRVAELS